jgi:hypothetical protein
MASSGLTSTVFAAARLPINPVLDGMAYQRKVFSQEEHDRSDPESRRVVIELIHRAYGIKFVSNPDKFGVDLLGDNEGIEIEHRHGNWKSSEATLLYPQINIPAGKGDRFWLESNRTTHYVILREDFKCVGIALGGDMRRVLREARPVNNPNRLNGQSDEPFYQLPYDIFTWIDVESGEIVPKDEWTARQSIMKRGMKEDL